jgi:hypothetical protein
VKKAAIIFAWLLLFCVHASIFGSPHGLLGGIYWMPSIAKAQVINTLANLGVFSIGFALWRVTRKKPQGECEFENKSNVQVVIFCIALYAIYFGLRVDCNDVFDFCIEPSASSSSVCYDNKGAYGCEE